MFQKKFDLVLKDKFEVFEEFYKKLAMETSFNKEKEDEILHGESSVYETRLQLIDMVDKEKCGGKFAMAMVLNKELDRLGIENHILMNKVVGFPNDDIYVNLYKDGQGKWRVADLGEDVECKCGNLYVNKDYVMQEFKNKVSLDDYQKGEKFWSINVIERFCYIKSEEYAKKGSDITPLSEKIGIELEYEKQAVEIRKLVKDMFPPIRTNTKEKINKEIKSDFVDTPKTMGK